MTKMDVLWKENNVLYNILCLLITENEKLFDRSDSKLYWKTVIHIYTLLHHALVGIVAGNLSVFLQTNGDIQLQTLYKFRMGYLTGWNFLFQTVFLFLALTHDALEWLGKHQSTLGSKIRYWRDVIFCSLVVPYTCFVFGMFWSLYAIDRELVFPKVYDEVIPWWFNQCVHTNILVLVVLETLLQSRRHPTHKTLELTVVGVVGALYAIVYYSIYFFANRWLYNVFGIMTWWQVCLFQLLIWSSSFVFYGIQFPVNRLIHGPEEEPEKIKVAVVQERIITVETLKTATVEQRNGEVKSNGEVKENGVAIEKIRVSEKNEFKTPEFLKTWSLKYRNSRSQDENSSL